MCPANDPKYAHTPAAHSIRTESLAVSNICASVHIAMQDSLHILDFYVRLLKGIVEGHSHTPCRVGFELIDEFALYASSCR